MHRLFVALRPPQAMRQALLATMSGVPGARWQDDDQLHLTLRFIGKVDRHGAEDVAAALASVRGTPVPLHVDGTGAFDRRGRVHTLRARVRADGALLRLQAAVERAVMRAGRPPEPRAFLPHITLARLAGFADDVRPWLLRTSAVSLQAEPVGAFLLYESILGRNGASYHAVERYPLAC